MANDDQSSDRTTVPSSLEGILKWSLQQGNSVSI